MCSGDGKILEVPDWVKEQDKTGILLADEVTLAFFRKYLDMPDSDLESMCREIIRLKREQPGIVLPKRKLNVSSDSDALTRR